MKRNQGIVFYDHVTLEGTGTSQDSLTRVLEVDVIAVVRVLELVGHHAESHDLLPDERVRPRDVHVDLGVVDLVGQPIVHDLRQVSAGQGGSTPIRMRREGPRNQILPCWLAVSQNVCNHWAQFLGKSPKSEKKEYIFSEGDMAQMALQQFFKRY